jgi:uncharacterized membrane protein
MRRILTVVALTVVGALQQPPLRTVRLTPRAALVAPTDDVGNACALVGAAIAGRSLGTRTQVGRALGGPVSAMAITFFASSIGALPANARAVSGIRDAAVLLATPLLLLDADPRALLETSKPYVKAFAVAVVGTVFATAVGARFVLPALTAALGRADAVGAVASLSAKNIGGGVNFCAVAATLRITPLSLSVALAADNVMALVYFPLCNYLAGDKDPSPGQVVSVADEADGIDAGSLLGALGTALGILAAATRLSPRAPLPAATLLSLFLAAVLPSAKESRTRRRLDRAANVLSETLLYLFFAGAGAAGGAAGACLVDAGPALLAFLGILYAGHALVVYTVGARVLKLPRAILCVASNAAIGGPATAAALCAGKKWDGAVAPAVAVGTVGYALATFLGLGIARVLS